jgi:hypothetical protein
MTLASLAAAQEFPNPDRLTSAVISVEGYSGQLNGWLTEDGKFLLGETQTLRTKIKLHWKVSGAELSRSQIVSLCDSYKSNKEDSYEVHFDHSYLAFIFFMYHSTQGSYSWMERCA